MRKHHYSDSKIRVRALRLLGWLAAGMVFQAASSGCNLTNTLQQSISSGISTGLSNLVQVLVVSFVA